MKKRTIFLLVLLLLIAYITLYCIFVPKVIFMNQSGYNIHISGNYIDDVKPTKKQLDDEIEEEPLKIRYRSLKKDKDTNYYLGFFSNKFGRKSSFWADWYFPDKRRNDGAFVQNEMKLPPEDFGWKNITFIIDENGDYHKIDKNTQ